MATGPTPLPDTLPPKQVQTLLQLARESIAHGLAHGEPLPVQASDYEEVLQAVRASFVTLQIQGRLRGCIGSLEASMPLVEDVVQHAYAAAFSDPRFPPLTDQELPRLDIHISILTPSTPMTFADEADLLRQLRPGVDGLIIAQGGRRATFLPSVWDSLPEPTQFLQHLKLKAGITEEPLEAWRYTAENIPEGEA